MEPSSPERAVAATDLGVRVPGVEPDFMATGELLSKVIEVFGCVPSFFASTLAAGGGEDKLFPALKRGDHL